MFFDADNDAQQRKIALTEIASNLNIKFELFLFPDQNGIGAVEALLLQIILPQYEQIFNCFDAYTHCLSVADSSFVLPNQKARFFAFADSTGQKTNLKKINFLDSNFYDLNHNSLSELYNFIDSHL